MKKTTIYRILSIVAFIALFILIHSLIHFMFNDLAGVLTGMIAAGFTGLLASMVVKTKFQAGAKTQLRWIFLKEPIPIFNKEQR